MLFERQIICSRNDEHNFHCFNISPTEYFFIDLPYVTFRDGYEPGTFGWKSKTCHHAKLPSALLTCTKMQQAYLRLHWNSSAVFIRCSSHSKTRFLDLSFRIYLLHWENSIFCTERTLNLLTRISICLQSQLDGVTMSARNALFLLLYLRLLF